MLKIGITGGIGAGKSYICKKLSVMGFPVFDCDANSKQIMNQDILVQDQLIQLLGKECYTEDGTLNRPYVAKLIFNNEQLKQDLENIVHPKVAQAFNQWAEAQNSPFVFVESAILYESSFDAHVDKVIVVDADMEVRIQRVMQRDLCTREQAEQRIKAQMDSAEKQKRAHYIIYNNPTEEINSQLFKLVKSLYSIAQQPK